MKVSLRWVTPEADKEIAYMARVSNPRASPDDPATKLIRYLMDHKHWSPFEMACMCVEIETTRDISRQILRHRAFHFQEFSQRYAEVVSDPEFGEARLQDLKNRQNSIVTADRQIQDDWAWWQDHVWNVCWTAYQAALAVGVAKEVARKLLPEGLSKTRMYMQGTIRDWLHYIGLRIGPETQKEHRDVAQAALIVLNEACPNIVTAALQVGVIPEWIHVEDTTT